MPLSVLDVKASLTGWLAKHDLGHACFNIAMYCLTLRQCFHMLNINRLLFASNYFIARLLLIIIVGCLAIKLLIQIRKVSDCITVFVVLAVGVISAYISNNKELCVFMLFLAASRDIKLKQLATAVFFAATTIVVIVLSGVFVGAIEMMTMESHYGANATRISLGFNHPNSLAAIVFTMVACVHTICFPRYNDACACSFVLGVAVISLVTESRTFILGVLLLTFSFYLASNVRTVKSLRRYLAISLMTILIAICISLAFMMLFDPENSFMQRLDGLFSTRLSLAHNYYIENGFSVFGLRNLGATSSTLTLDNAYAWFALIFGLMPSIILLLIMLLFFRKALIDQTLSACVVLLGVWSLIGVGESFALLPSFNFALLGFSCVVHKESITCLGSYLRVPNRKESIDRVVFARRSVQGIRTGQNSGRLVQSVLMRNEKSSCSHPE